MTETLDPRFALGPIYLPSDWSDEEIAAFARAYGGCRRFERKPKDQEVPPT